MRLTTKDTVGLLLVVGTASALLVHNAPEGHRSTHIRPVADAGGSVTSTVDVATFAFHDVNVLPMDGRAPLRRQVVVVRDGFVTRIGPVGVVDPPEGALLVDGRGTRWLAPGLTDAHVHLGDEPEALLPLFLANGVTTVFNLEGTIEHLRLRDRVATGEVAGPTIFTSGPFVDDEVVRTPAQAARMVRRQRELGYDFVKVHGALSPSSYEALAAAAEDERIALVGHAPRNLPLGEALRNGQDAISHAEELIYTELVSLNTAELPAVAQALEEAGTWVTPALVNFDNVADQWAAPAALEAALDRPGARYLPPSLRREWARSRALTSRRPETRQRIEQMRAFHRPLVAALHAEGVPLLAGTDAGMPGMVPGFALHDEVEALHHAGLSPLEALATATSNAGRFVRDHVDETVDFGVVREGARADLVLYTTDPTEDLATLRRPGGVMVRGRWYDRSQLDRMLGRLTASR